MENLKENNWVKLVAPKIKTKTEQVRSRHFKQWKISQILGDTKQELKVLTKSL